MTHVVANTVLSQKYEIAARQRLPVMNQNWVDEVWNANLTADVPATDPSFNRCKLPTFHKLSITSTNISTKERERLKKVIEENGGQYTGGFTSDDTNVLLVPRENPASKKFSAAVQYKKYCLIPKWIDDSFKCGYAMPCEKYKVLPAIKASTPERRSLMPAATKFAPDNTLSSDVSCITNNAIPGNVDETTVSMMENRTPLASIERSRRGTITAASYQEAFNRIDFTNVKKAGAFLDGCKVYLSGFKPADKDKLVKLLNSSGAVRLDELNDQVSHMVVGDHVAVDHATITSKELGATVVKLDWIVESLKMKEPADEQHYLYLPALVQEKNSQHDPEPPSPSSKKVRCFLPIKIYML